MMSRESLPDILTIPELALTGYTFKSKEEAFTLGEEVGGSLTEKLIELAGKFNVFINIGFLEREGKNLYNSSLLLSGEEVIGVYRKVHLFFREKEIFEPGNRGFSVYEINGVRTGLLICFDWVFPEAMRSLALQGAEVVLHPSNLVLPYYQDAAVTRAVENRVFVILANRNGVENRGSMKNEFTGGSEVVAPDGEIILKVGKDEEGIYSVGIDPEKARNKRITEFNNIFKDRREDQYNLD